MSAKDEATVSTECSGSGVDASLTTIMLVAMLMCLTPRRAMTVVTAVPQQR
jgi:hypothetical protein